MPEPLITAARNQAKDPPACKAGAFLHPQEVLSRPDLTVGDKREILAAWASDAHAVSDAPSLRQLESGAVVSVDAVLEALRALDGAEPGPERQVASERGRTAFPRALRLPFGNRDDDDDPPPCPAAALPFGLELTRRRKWGTAPEPLAA